MNCWLVCLQKKIEKERKAIIFFFVKYDCVGKNVDCRPKERPFDVVALCLRLKIVPRDLKRELTTQLQNADTPNSFKSNGPSHSPSSLSSQPQINMSLTAQNKRAPLVPPAFPRPTTTGKIAHETSRSATDGKSKSQRQRFKVSSSRRNGMTQSYKESSPRQEVAVFVWQVFLFVNGGEKKGKINML